MKLQKSPLFKGIQGDVKKRISKFKTLPLIPSQEGNYELKYLFQDSAFTKK